MTHHLLLIIVHFMIRGTRALGQIWEDTIISCNKVLFILWLNTDSIFSIYFYLSMRDVSIFQQDCWKEPDKLKCLNIFLIMKFYHEKIFWKNNPLLEIYQQNISRSRYLWRLSQNNFIELLLNLHFDKKNILHTPLLNFNLILWANTYL